MAQLRALTSADAEELERLNSAAVPAVPPTTAAELRDLLELADHALAVVESAEDAPGGALRAFLLGFDPGRPYSSENYRFFEGRGVDSLYVDRIVVDEEYRGAGLGRLLYREVFARAAQHGRAEVTCEVNLEPPNPSSLAFHRRLGFEQVGTQATKGGSVVVALLAASVPAPTA